MKLERMTEIETNDIHVGDRIRVSKYTATCQEITPKGALFLLDQYLDKPMVMNVVDTNKGGYEKSDLRKALQSKEVLNIFAVIRDHMIPFENSDLLRIPFAGELFEKLPSGCKPDGHEQWPLMQDRHNRLALRCGNYEWGWLQNKDKASSADFCLVTDYGNAHSWYASSVFGVRPVFQIANEIYKIETNDIHVGDRIHVGQYTATCTSVTSKAALFLLDQYITGHGYLREAMQSEEVLNDFAGIRRYMVQFEDGDMLKIPFGYTWRNSEISRFRPIFLISNEIYKKKEA